jgi:hypothetical protein
MRARRAHRCLVRAEAAHEAGFADDARDALDEARLLSGPPEEIARIEALIAAAPVPDAKDAAPWSRWIYIAVSILLVALTASVTSTALLRTPAAPVPKVVTRVEEAQVQLPTVTVQNVPVVSVSGSAVTETDAGATPAVRAEGPEPLPDAATPPREDRLEAEAEHPATAPPPFTAPSADAGSAGPAFTAPPADARSAGPAFTTPSADAGSAGPAFTAPPADARGAGPAVTAPPADARSAGPARPVSTFRESIVPVAAPVVNESSASRDAGAPVIVSPNVAPVPAVSTPPPRDETVDVRAVLSRYEHAYSQLDPSQARAVWPGVDERALSRAFSSLASQRVSLGRCDVTLNGVRAQAICAGSQTWTPKVGGGGPRTEARRWTFELTKTGDAWRIERALAR